MHSRLSKVNVTRGSFFFFAFNERDGNNSECFDVGRNYLVKFAINFMLSISRIEEVSRDSVHKKIRSVFISFLFCFSVMHTKS